MLNSRVTNKRTRSLARTHFLVIVKRLRYAVISKVWAWVCLLVRAEASLTPTKAKAKAKEVLDLDCQF